MHNAHWALSNWLHVFRERTSYGQCISFECQQHPSNCGCPGTPPPVATKENRSVAAPLNCMLEGGCNPITTDPIIQSSTSTSTVTPPAPTCTIFQGPIPIGTICFISGPRTGECISIECLDRPDACGCPGAPPPAAGKEKRVPPWTGSWPSLLGTRLRVLPVSYRVHK